MQLPTAPLVGAADASHGPDTHVASSENADAGAETTRQDLDPDDMYPASHVGAHDDPIASVDEHVGPGTPFAMAPEASHAHVASAAQPPWPEQLPGHAGRLQSKPVQPAWQRQLPGDVQRPRPEQPEEQCGSVQPLPAQPPEHAHRPGPEHTPCALHS